MRRLPAALLAALLGLLTVGVAPAGAGIVTYQFTLDPTSGPEGTTVTFTPTDFCSDGDGLYTNVVAGVSTTPNPVEADFIASMPVNGDGSWQLQTTIAPGTPLGSITFYAVCRGEFAPPALTGDTRPEAAAAAAGPLTIGTYAPQTFTVTALPTSTSTTTTTAPTTTTTAPTTTTTTPASGITVSPSSLYAGDTATITGQGFAPGAAVEVTVFSAPLVIGTVTADAEGDVSTTWTVPTGFAVGSHTVQLSGTGADGQLLTLTAGITVLQQVAAPTSTTTVGTLPVTGSGSTQPLVVVGAVLLLVGGATVIVARRRSTV